MAKLISKGGKGSGNWGHAGRPGKVGGSAPRDGAYQQGELFDVDKYVDVQPYNELGDIAANERFDLLSMSPPDGDEKYLELRRETDAWFTKHGGGSALAGMRYSDVKPIESTLLDSTVSYIANDTGIDRATVERIVKKWLSAANEDVDSMFIQSEIAAMFHDTLGTELSDWQKREILDAVGRTDDGTGLDHQVDDAQHTILVRQTLSPVVDGDTTTARRNVQRVIKSMYNHTQEQLAADGIDGLLVYRGVRSEDFQRYDVGKSYEVWTNAAESYTRAPYVASMFGKVFSNVGGENEKILETGGILATYVPRRRILSTVFSGFGSLNESEVVVLGSNRDGISSKAAVAAIYNAATNEVVENFKMMPDYYK